MDHPERNPGAERRGRKATDLKRNRKVAGLPKKCGATMDTNRRVLFLSLFLLGAVPAAAFADENFARPNREQVRSQLRRSSRFAGPSAARPDAFQVTYSLPRTAALSVTLLDLHRIPLRTFQIPKGEPGTLTGDNVLTLWDGKDIQGKDMPAGEYWAALSFRFEDGTVDNKRFRMVKP